MADQVTTSRLRRRRRWKIWTAPTLAALAGLLAKAIYGYSPVAGLFNLAQNFLSAATGLKDWLEASPAASLVADWVAAPALLFSLTWGAMKWTPVSWVLNRIFPDPPRFVLSDLEAQRRMTMLGLKGDPPALVGRAEEQAQLASLLERTRQETDFRWMAITAPSGTGKTRLALEWLEQAKASGWECGVVDPEDATFIKDWRAARPTALVIDEARTVWLRRDLLDSTLTRLKLGASKGRPVRVLVIAQLAPYAPGGAPDDVQTDEARGLHLQPLDDADTLELASAYGLDASRAELIARECAGKPRAAIIMAQNPHASTYAQALERWAYRILPELRTADGAPDDSVMIGLIAAGLAGPVSTSLLAQAEAGFNPLSLKRFFPAEAAATLERTVPRLLPEDHGQDVALRLAVRLPPARRQALLELLVEHCPTAMDESLGALWSDHPDWFGSQDAHAARLMEMQQAFDARWPDLVDQSRASLAAVVNRTAPDDLTLELINPLFSVAIAGINRRPFDREMRLLEAMAAANAIKAYGVHELWSDLEGWGARLASLAAISELVVDREIRKTEAIAVFNAVAQYARARRWPDLERWDARLVALTAMPEFMADVEIRRCEAKAAVHAVSAYGKAEQWSELERWGARLAALTAMTVFVADREIRRHEAQAATHAISAYGKAERWPELERWSARLAALVAIPEFAVDREIRSSEARAAASAANAFGWAEQWSDLERWGDRLTALAAMSEFALDCEIWLNEAISAVNAVGHYGRVARWSDLERWGARLASLIAIPEFAIDLEIRLQEAIAAFNAVSLYGGAHRWPELERWGARLASLVAIPAFAMAREIRLREANAAVNAVSAYGKAAKWLELERWGARLAALVAIPEFAVDREIKLAEAKVAVNAVISYGVAGRLGSGPERHWKTRLAHIAQLFPQDPDIQALAKDFDLNWLSQRARDFPYGTVGGTGN